MSLHSRFDAIGPSSPVILIQPQKVFSPYCQNLEVSISSDLRFGAAYALPLLYVGKKGTTAAFDGT